MLTPASLTRLANARSFDAILPTALSRLPVSSATFSGCENSTRKLPFAISSAARVASPIRATIPPASRRLAAITAKKTAAPQSSRKSDA